MTNTAYFDPVVGGTGLTVTDDGNPITGLDNDGHRERLVPAFSNVVQVAKFVVDTAQDVNDDAATASTAAITATTQAGIATTKAGEASASALAASNSATAASNSADEAEYWAGQAGAAVSGAVKVSINDTIAGTLDVKTISTDNCLLLSVVNAGGNEKLGIGGALKYVTRSTGSISAQDKGLFINFTTNGGRALPATSGVAEGWFCYVRNLSTGGMSINAPLGSSIDNVASLVLSARQTVLIMYSGGQYYSQRIGPERVREVRTIGTVWTCPAGVYSVKVIGVGGGGGGSSSSTNTTGCGGGGGGYFETMCNVTPGVAYSFTIGAGGSGAGSAGGNGANGGNTTFNDGVTTYTASGGSGATNGATIALGGSALNGSINISGGNGRPAESGSPTMSIAGGSALSNGPSIGRASSTASYGVGGLGGANGGAAQNGSNGVLILEY